MAAVTTLDLLLAFESIRQRVQFPGDFFLLLLDEGCIALAPAGPTFNNPVHPIGPTGVVQNRIPALPAAVHVDPEVDAAV